VGLALRSHGFEGEITGWTQIPKQSAIALKKVRSIALQITLNRCGTERGDPSLRTGSHQSRMARSARSMLQPEQLGPT